MFHLRLKQKIRRSWTRALDIKAPKSRQTYSTVNRCHYFYSQQVSFSFVSIVSVSHLLILLWYFETYQYKTLRTYSEKMDMVSVELDDLDRELIRLTINQLPPLYQVAMSRVCKRFTTYAYMLDITDIPDGHKLDLVTRMPIAN